MGGCGPTYIHRRGLGILFKKLWIFQQHRQPRNFIQTTSYARSWQLWSCDSLYRFIIDNCSDWMFSFLTFYKIVDSHFRHFGETGRLSFSAWWGGFVVLALIVASLILSWAHFARPKLFASLSVAHSPYHPLAIASLNLTSFFNQTQEMVNL